MGVPLFVERVAAHRCVVRIAPNAKLRRAVVSYGSEATPASDADDAAAQPKASPPRYRARAELMHRAFGIDVLERPECGGRMRVLSTITDAKIISAIRDHLAGRGPPSTPPPPSLLP